MGGGGGDGGGERIPNHELAWFTYVFEHLILDLSRFY